MLLNWLRWLFRAKPLMFVIDGTDGSGKATHVKLLQVWLEAHGYEVAVFDYPQYGQPSAKLVEMYLNKELGGNINALDPHEISVYYAIDRQTTAPAIRAALASGKVVLCNRYQSSNKAHQGSKISDRRRRLRFYRWLDRLEFNMLGVVRPTKTFVLRMPTAQAQQFAGQKPQAAHLTGDDLHESDSNHLTAAAACYLELCRYHPWDHILIECTGNDGEVQDIPTINEKLQQGILPLLERG